MKPPLVYWLEQILIYTNEHHPVPVPFLPLDDCLWTHGHSFSDVAFVLSETYSASRTDNFRAESCRYKLLHVDRLLHRPTSVSTAATNWPMVTALPCNYTSSILHLCKRPWARGACATMTSSWEIVKRCVPRGAVAQCRARASRQLWDR